MRPNDRPHERTGSRPAAATAALLALLVVVGCGPAGRTDAPPADADAALPGDVELDPATQKRIWDLEHVTFLIETYVGAPLAAAVRDGDPGAIAGRMRAGFEGRWPAAADVERRTLEAAGVVERRAGLAANAAETVDARGAARRMLEPLDGAGSIDAAGWRVLAIDGDAAGDGPLDLDATLLLSVRGTAAAGGPFEHESIYDATFIADSLDSFRDGAPVLAALRWRAATDREAPSHLMREITADVGLDDVDIPDNWTLPLTEVRNHRYQLAVDDFDRDGWPDVVVAAISGGPWLLRNVDGRRFESVAADYGLHPEPDADRELSAHALAAWIDADNDGFPDLVLGRRLYRNDGGRRFVEVDDAGGLRFELVPFGASVADFDGDGLLDLYLVNQKGFRRREAGARPWVGDPEGGTENHLWRNDGGFRFTNVTAAARAAGGRHQTFAAAVFHLDDDPHPDLYLANDFGNNVLLRNTGDGRFEDVTEATATGDFATSMGVATGDLDNDGRAEIYVANMYSKMGRRIIAHVDDDDYPPGVFPLIRGSCAGNRLYRSDGRGAYDELSEQLAINAVGWAYAPAMVDLDGDGLLDLYATTGFLSYERGKPDG